MRLLIFKVNQLGDAVVFLPVVQQFRRLWPEAALTVFATPATAPLYASAAAVYSVDRDAFNRAWRQPVRLLQAWGRAARPAPEAALISYDQGTVAHLLARASGAPVRVGSGDLRIRGPHGLTHAVPAAGRPIVAWNWAMGRTLAAALRREADWPEGPVPPDLSALVPRVPPRAAGAARVVIHAGSSRPFRQWPLDRFAALAARLADEMDVTWIDRPETAAATLSARVRRVRCATVPELAAELATADLFVGNNSGPMHLASGLGLAGVVVSGPTHPQWDPAWWPERWTVLRTSGLSCLPCESLRRAPAACENLANPHACLTAWSVDAVAEACRQRLRGAARPRGGDAAPL